MRKSFYLFICSILFSGLSHAYNPEHLAQFIATQHCEECDLNQINLSPEILGSDHYRGAILYGSYFYGSTIEDLDLQSAHAQNINGVGLLLHNNELSYADFSYSDLPDLTISPENRGYFVRFTGAGVDGGNFAYTQLDTPQFQQASMSNAVLYHVDWPNANLHGARLRGADLTYAMLRGANLTYANLSDALLSHADLSETNLYGATVTNEQLAKALSVCNATLPDGSVGVCKPDRRVE